MTLKQIVLCVGHCLFRILIQVARGCIPRVRLNLQRRARVQKQQDRQQVQTMPMAAIITASVVVQSGPSSGLALNRAKEL